MRSRASVQSPRSYDLQNLSGPQVASRLEASASADVRKRIRKAIQDSSHRLELSPKEASAGLTDADVTFGYDVGDVRRYGAKGDGVTDDAAAIQLAIDTIEATGGGVLYFPAGVYVIGSQIRLGRSMTYRGDGKSINVANCTVLKYTGDEDAFVDLWPVDTPSASNMRFEHLGFWYETATDSELKGLFHLRCSTFVDFVDCGIYGGEYGIILDQAEIVSIRQCDFENQTTGAIWLTNGAEKSAGASELFTNRITVRECQFNANAGCFIVDDGGVAHVYADNNFNHGDTHIRICGAEGVYISGNELEIANADSISFHSTKFGGATPANVVKSRGVCAHGNYIFQTGAASGGFNIVGNSIATASIVGNVVQTTAGLPVIINPDGADSLVAYGNFQRGAGTNEGPKFSYKEGTWTPVVTFGGASTGIAGTFAGRYTKIGREVHYHCTLRFTSKGSATGSMVVSGLPVAAGTISTMGARIGQVANLATGFNISAWVQEASQDIYLQKTGLTSNAAITDADVTNTTRIDISGSYMAAD